MNITTYLGSYYTASYNIIDLVGAAPNIYNPAAYMQILLSKAIAYYNLSPINYL